MAPRGLEPRPHASHAPPRPPQAFATGRILMEAEVNSREAEAVVPILDELAAAQRTPKIQASGKLRIELLYEPINH